MKAAKKGAKAADAFCTALGISPQARPSRALAAEVSLMLYAV